MKKTEFFDLKGNGTMSGLTIYILIGCVGAAGVLVVLLIWHLKRSKPLPMDELEGHEFE